MKVKWQSDAPNMELKVPKGQYLPYELPVATKEVLGGVKVDGDTINITSDGVISTQKVDLSGVATKAELNAVQDSIPDTTGLATKSELATIESKIPDTSGLATKVELQTVEGFIPSEYLKNASVTDNKLTITKSSGGTIEFSGGSSGGNEDGLLENTLVNYENTTATKIRDGFFQDSATFVAATFTNVGNVGPKAFSNCRALTQVSLPNALDVGDSCFSHCLQLSSVNLPNAKRIGYRSFLSCTSLTSINLPRLEILRGSVFFDCSNLAKVDLGSCQQFYYSNSSQFSYCGKLTTLILRSNTECSLPYSVKSAFNGTPIADTGQGEGYVYVPRDQVDKYKDSTNWAVIADRIRAIEDYPDITGG